MINIFYRNIIHNNFNKSALTFAKQRQDAHFSQTAPRYAIPGDVITTNCTKGIDHLRDPRLNKGLAFTLAERQAFGIHGLLSSEFRTLEQQLAICKLSVDRYRSVLNKYLYLSELQDTNETLFYTLISENIDKFMPLINTPTVGLACMRFGLVYKKARGLFISIHDRGHVIDVFKNWPERDIRIIVVTDGERILGLGDLGAHGMGIPQGKTVLLTALAGIKPHQCLPVCLDTGTNNQALIEDPLYIGIREKRAHRNDYDELIAEFLAAGKKLYGAQTLVMMEDFAVHNAYRLLNRYRDDYCVFNDDIQATAAAVVAGLMVACNGITKQKLKDNTYLFYGAGSTGVGIANLLCDAMTEEGLSSEAARNRCYMFDVDGLLSRKRTKAIPRHARDYARDLEPEMDFEKCIKKFKATCLIGTSTCGSAFTPLMLRELAKNTERPLIFPLSNPTHQSECTPQEAFDNTEGRCIFASGSPFPAVTYKGQMYKTGQANNYYVFPGLALGVVAANAYRVTDAMFLTAAKTLAKNVTEDDIKVGRIYPHISNMRNVSLAIAADIVLLAYDQQLTYLCPKPKDVLHHVQDCLYEFKYPSHLPKFYAYPDTTRIIKLKNIEGRCIFASGSPFPAVTYKGQMYKTGQANNYYVFPGLALGVVAANAYRVTDAMFLTAAKTLAKNVTEDDIKVGRIYPHISNMRNVSLAIAADIVLLAYDQQLTYLCPKPKDVLHHVQDCLYEFKYPSHLPKFYAYPDTTRIIKLKNIEVLHKGLLPNRKKPSTADYDKPIKLT